MEGARLTFCNEEARIGSNVHKHLENILHLRSNQHPLMNCSRDKRGDSDLHSVIRKARFGSNEEAMFITLQAILTLKNRHSFIHEVLRG